MSATVSTVRFGDMPYSPEQLLTLSGGLIGLPETERFLVIAPHGPDGPLYWLQSIDRGDLAVVVADVARVVPAYRPRVPAAELSALGLSSLDEAMVLGVCVLSDTPANSTVNLLAPLLINPVTRQGRQVLLDEGDWSARHPLDPGEEG